MTKTIDTLIEDMNHVLATGEGWSEEISLWVANDITKSLNRQFKSIGTQRKGTLRPSNIGTPCERKLWYSVNQSTDSEPLPTSVQNKFIFGDLTESYILGLAKASGHTVEGLQDSVDVCGLRGSRDCVIDGMLVDVKSCSSRAFDKFKYGKIRSDDPFGYLSQLSSYLYGSRNDPLVTYKKEAAFLAFDKQHAHITLDRYDLTAEIEGKEDEVLRKMHIVNEVVPPDRPKWDNYQYNRSTREYELVETAEDWADGKSGNRKLSLNCSYCNFKKTCWPDLRKFVRSNSVQFLTKVEREPTGAVFEDEGF